MTHLFPALLMTALLVSAPVYAQENKTEEAAKPAAETVKKEEPKKADKPKAEKKKEDAPKQEDAPKKQAATPVNKWLDAENAMIDPLSTLDKESIYILRQKHSIIRVIGVVERDIGAAVKSCSKANPDMKGDIETRFTDWKNAVKPVVATARKNLDQEIEKQEIVSAKEFKRVLKLNDDAFDYTDKRTTKNPVSERAACENLMASMNDTEDKMVRLLQDTLLPPSVIKSRIDRDNKADAKKLFSTN